MAFQNPRLTQAGLILLAKLQNNQTTTITKIVLGDGTLPTPETIPNDMVNPIFSLDITSVQRASQTLKVFVTLANGSITTGFYARELGIYAIDPDEGEILYSYANAGDKADYIPSNTESPLTISYILNLEAFNANNVTVNISNTGFVTQEQLQDVAKSTSFVYNCTGTNDNIAICNLVNSFLNATGEFAGTPSLTMKLVVNGIVGLPAAPNYGPGTGTATNPRRYFEFSSNQTRGARVHVDWSNAQLPALTGLPAYTAYFYHTGSGSTVYHSCLAYSIAANTAVCYGFYNNSTGTIYINNSYTTISNSSAISYGFYNASSGTIHITNSCGYCENTAGNVALYVINNAANGTIYLNSCYFSGVSMYTVYVLWSGSGTSTGQVYINRCYFFVKCTATSNVQAYAIYGSNFYMSNSYLYAVCASTMATTDTSFGVYVIGNAGGVYINNSFCFADNNGSSNGTAVATYTGGPLCITNSYLLGVGNGSSLGGAALKTPGTSPPWAQVYISNSFCSGVNKAGGSSYGITNYTNSSIATIFVDNCYIVATYALYNASTGGLSGATAIYVSNSYIVGNASGATTSFSSVGIYIVAGGAVYAVNCLIVGYATATNEATFNSGYALYIANVNATYYSRFIAQNCTMRGYRNSANASGIGSGIFMPATVTNFIVVLIGCTFNRFPDPNGMVQDTDMSLRTGATKYYHILGCIFHDSAISIGGSMITYIATPTANAYMPQYANFFGLTS